MGKKALITGASGMDGSNLARFLLKKGYKVYGIERRVSCDSGNCRHNRLSDIENEIEIFIGDIRDYNRMFEIINKVKPDELYHLAALSQVGISFKNEFEIIDSNIKGTVNLLHILKNILPECKFFHASSSEQFGKVLKSPQNENTPFNPVSPYAIGKVACFFNVKMYRNAYNLFTCNSITFNHECEHRPTQFVTRKITHAVAKIYHGLQDKLYLGNLDARRDWGYSPDYCRAFYLMLQQNKPDDYVIATGETHSVREFCKIAFNKVGLNYKDYVEVDPKFYRPAEVNVLTGDYSKAKKVLGWEPKVKFEELISKMVDYDLELVGKENV